MPSIQEFDQSAIALALKNLCDGVFYEPRLYYDSITMPATANQVTAGNPDVFRNGEQFPVRITHMLAAFRSSVADPDVPDETIIQRANLRVIQHDNFYMNRALMPLPLWANVICGAPDLVTQGSASWHFEKPFILSTRDSLQINVVLESDPTNARIVGVSVTGYGLVSKTPYFLSGQVSVTDTTATALSTDSFRNDGAEPIVITDLTAFCGSEEGAASPAGDIRQLRVSLRQIGNGTNATWTIGPTNPSLTTCPALLLGVTAGRSIIHKIPGDGWIWEPGEGVSVEVSESAASEERLAIGFLGHIVVT